MNRDKHKCRVCGKTGELDAHHITDRSKMPLGGYVKENGIALCPECHLYAEEFHITNGGRPVPGFLPDDLYKLIGSNYDLAVEKCRKFEK